MLLFPIHWVENNSCIYKREKNGNQYIPKHSAFQLQLNRFVDFNEIK